jgi:Telomere-length maintenance and DNA damage repair
MSGIHLHEICEKLNSQTARQRHTALADLQALLARDDALRQLNDPSNSGLFGALLDNYAKEVAYSKRSKAGQALLPLHQSAECFKGLIEKARLAMLRRNVKAALEHILQYFPDHDEPEYREVAPSFCASLRLIFSHPPHLEQLSPENWQTVVEFCIAKVEVSNLYQLPTSQNDNFDGNQMQTDSLSMRKEIGDLIFTLQSFVNYPGAPIQSIRESLVAFLLNFLASYNTISDARLSAVISLNRVLQHTSINDITLAKAVAPHVLDLVPRIWDARIPGLRERILVTISTIYPHLCRMAVDGKLGPSTSSIIHKMLDVMSRETRFEDRKLGLQLDDIIITPLSRQSAPWNHRPFQSLIGPFFSLNPHPTSSEFPWMILQLQSSLLRLFDSIHVEETASSQTNNFEHHVKRRRLDPNNRLQALVDECLSSNANHLQKLGALQKFAFCLNDFRIPNDSFDFHLSLKNLEMVRDMGNAEIVGWSLLCICCIIGRLGSSELVDTKSEIWTNIWIACVKYVAMSPTCRPASAVMEGILRKKILPVSAIVPHVKWMVEFVEQRGPANLVDNSCDFWSSLFNTLEDGGISTEKWRRDALPRWILFRMDVSVTKDTLSNGERISSLFMPLLRLLTTDKWTSTPTVGSSSLQFRPHGPIGDHLTTQASNLPLLNFLLDGSFEEDASPSSNRTVWTTDLSCPLYIREFLEARYQSLCELYVAGRRTGGSSSPEELSWLFGLTVTIMLLLRISPPRYGLTSCR